MHYLYRFDLVDVVVPGLVVLFVLIINLDETKFALKMSEIKTNNEHQLENSLRLDSIISLLDLVHDPN